MKAFKCPHCGGDVQYDIAKEQIKCSFCDSVIRREDYQKFLDENNLIVSNEYVCPQCGGAILSYDDTIASFCSYCGSPVVFNKRIKEETKPDGIIPFKVQKELAKDAYHKSIAKSWFAPDWMYDPGEIHMTGIYLPYYSYTAKTQGAYNAPGKKTTETFEETIYDTYKVYFNIDAEYEGTRFDASASFPDAMSETIDDFNLSGVKQFETSYMAGFYADGGMVGEDEYTELVKTLVTADLFKGTTVWNGITVVTNNIKPDVEIENKKYLLPVWLCTHRVKDRVCYAAINGQTGKTAVDIPIDKSKYWMTSIIIAAVISLLMNVIASFSAPLFLLASSILIIAFIIVSTSLAVDIQARNAGIDDIGRTGYQSFKRSAIAGSSNSSMLNKKVGRIHWQIATSKIGYAGFIIPIVAVFVLLLVLKIPYDELYYAIGIGYIIASLVLAFKLIDRQNYLASRDIPVFTMKRGGDEK